MNIQTVDEIARKVGDGGRLNRREALTLYEQAPTHLLGCLADDEVDIDAGLEELVVLAVVEVLSLNLFVLDDEKEFG